MLTMCVFIHTCVYVDVCACVFITSPLYLQPRCLFWLPNSDPIGLAKSLHTNETHLKVGNFPPQGEIYSHRTSHQNRFLRVTLRNVHPSSLQVNHSIPIFSTSLKSLVTPLTLYVAASACPIAYLLWDTSFTLQVYFLLNSMRIWPFSTAGHCWWIPSWISSLGCWELYFFFLTNLYFFSVLFLLNFAQLRSLIFSLILLYPMLIFSIYGF